MRIAWVSPLPPTPSGIADYSFELLPFVAELADVTVFAEETTHGAPNAPNGIAVRRPEELAAMADRFDAVFHHLGNNPWHEFAYRLALDVPGIAVLHEVVLHHMLDWVFFGAGRLDAKGYRDVLRAEYGEAGDRLASLRLKGAFTYLDFFLFPLSGHVVRRSRGVVVHGHGVANQVLESSPGVPVWTIPHHAAPAELPGVDRVEARRRLGLPRDAFLVGHFGFLTRPKQPAVLLEGFRHLVEARPGALLLMVGENQVALGFPGLARRHDVERNVRSVGFVDLPEFSLYLKAVDVVVNLRYPTAGEASGTLARALAERQATIVSDIGSLAELPDDVTLKVEVDGDQASHLGEHLKGLARDGALKERLEAAAGRYARAELDRGRCAGMYVDAARSSAGGLSPSAA
jgi:glycosyltransferase involved in cell wall biosynthesis